MRQVETVVLFFPNTEDCSEVRYKVGKDRVTKIEEILTFPAEFCTKTIYNVYEGDKIIATMYSVSLVIYFKEI
jgi:hypothetical protein